MREHPIIFSGEMVRAILNGRKTQTRRIVKPQPNYMFEDCLLFKDSTTPIKCPYGQPGDKLMVCQKVEANTWTGKQKIQEQTGIVIEIIDIRVERLQDISEEDAQLEGCKNDVTLIYDKSDYLGLYALERFRELWNSIHGKDAWDKNPWVWVIEFKVI